MQLNRNGTLQKGMRLGPMRPDTDAAQHPLPPAQVPQFRQLTAQPVVLRPMQLADNAIAFALSEIAFTPDGATTAQEQQERQARWDAGTRAWFGWLHARARENAWVATSGENGVIIGYARAVRDETQRLEELTELFVHPAFQRGQVGKALLQAVLTPEVPTGWRRIIVAHPGLAPLALYLRWGTYPLGTAVYISFRPQPLPLAALPQKQDGGKWPPTLQRWGGDGGESIAALDRAVMGVERLALLHFIADQLGGRLVVDERDGRIVGYGMRSHNEIGPVVGTTPEDAVAVVAAHLQAILAAGEVPRGMWVPCANIALIDWLRHACPLPISLLGQVTIMASDPALIRHLDRCVLTPPPYIW